MITSRRHPLFLFFGGKLTRERFRCAMSEASRTPITVRPNTRTRQRFNRIRTFRTRNPQVNAHGTLRARKEHVRNRDTREATRARRTNISGKSYTANAHTTTRGATTNNRLHLPTHEKRRRATRLLEDGRYTTALVITRPHATVRPHRHDTNDTKKGDNEHKRSHIMTRTPTAVMSNSILTALHETTAHSTIHAPPPSCARIRAACAIT